MKPRLRTDLCAFLLILMAGGLAAEGAGGTFASVQVPGLAPSFLPAEAAVPGLRSSGGFGYGVDRDGFIVGGFGMGFVDDGLLGDPTAKGDKLAGGIGGLIIGQRLVRQGRVHLDLCLRLGAGGGARNSGSWQGWAFAYAEPYAELLVELAPWMALSAQAGYRFMGNIAPVLSLQGISQRSPVIGLAVSWGAFQPGRKGRGDW